MPPSRLPASTEAIGSTIVANTNGHTYRISFKTLIMTTLACFKNNEGLPNNHRPLPTLTDIQSLYNKTADNGFRVTSLRLY
jgi:hypothetical protein